MATHIYEVANRAILDGASNEEALEAVKKHFPKRHTKLQNIAWYRSDLRRKGLLDPNRRAEPVRRVTYGTLPCVGIYPTVNGKVASAGSVGKTTGLKLSKRQAFQLARVLLDAADGAQESVDVTAFRNRNQVTVTSIVKKRK